MSRVFHCIYTSRASPSFDEHAIPGLLEAARLRNAARGITGVLLYVDGTFFQVLEGDEAAVAETFERIREDNRHGRVTQIIREPIFERTFTDWTMGFANVSFADLTACVGTNDFFTTTSCLEQLGPGRARKLLEAFRQGRWRADQTGINLIQQRRA
jgi:FAD-dependent sensor of blue light